MVGRMVRVVGALVVALSMSLVHPGVVTGSSAASARVDASTASGTAAYGAYNGVETFRATDGEPMALFGGYRGGIAARSNVIAVAAFYDDSPVTDAGAVYSYYRTPRGWKAQKLVSPTPVTGGQFGRSVSLGSSTRYGPADRLAVGAWREGGGQVHLYVLRANGTWRYQATVSGCCEFGMDVALSGRTMVVGTRWSDRADVFEETPAGTWQSSAVLEPPVPQGQAHFGVSVAMASDDPNWIVVGDYAKGAIFLFENVEGSWAFRQEIAAPAGSSTFGASVDMTSDFAVVGAPRTGYPRQRGAAYVYRKEAETGTWVFDGELSPPDLPSAAYFGADVSVSGATIAVGAPEAEYGYPTGGPGEVFVFQRSDAWTLQQRVRSPEAVRGDGFGEAVSVDSIHLVAGAPYRRGGRGAAYRFVSVSTPERLAFVTSSPSPLPKQDQVLVDRLRANHFEVLLVDDDALLPPTDVAAILISSSVVPSKVGTTYRDVPITVVSWEPYLFDDLGFTDGGSGDQGETSTLHTRVQETAPMNGGLDWGPDVFSTPTPLSFGRVRGAARIYAAVPGEKGRAVWFGYRERAEMAGGLRAPEARFGLFLTYGSPTRLTGSTWLENWWEDRLWFTDGGWARFDATVRCAIDHDNRVTDWECFEDPGVGPPTAAER